MNDRDNHTAPNRNGSARTDESVSEPAHGAVVAIETPREADAGPGSSLCLACGLCCNGVLHGKTIIQLEEADAVRRLGLTVEISGAAAYFLQPCALFVDERCAAYPNHPGTCQAYRCALLKKQQKGEVTHEEAMRTVRRARALHDELVALLPGSTTPSPVTGASTDTNAEADAPPALPAPPERATVLLARARLAVYLKKHFVKPAPAG